MAGIQPMSELTCIFLDEKDCILILLNLEFFKMLGYCTIWVAL